MNYQEYGTGKRLAVQIVTGVTILAGVVAAGCSATWELTPEDRKKDIELLAKWARDLATVSEASLAGKGKI